MMGRFSAWIYGIIIASAAASLIMELTPEGRVKWAVKFSCGIMVSLALLSIVTDFDLGAFSMYMAEYRGNAEKTVSSAQEEAKAETRFIIEEKTAAYILEKAVGDIDVSVKAKWSEDGYWYPIEAEIRGDVEESERDRLSKIMEGELGISAENQKWISGTKD
jgi:hypothetical protein